MDYQRNDQGLLITIDEDEQQELREFDEIQSDQSMFEFFESLICNSELDWVDPSETGDLTSAPMLGVRGENDTIIERWAFMDYQIKSVLEDLLNEGAVQFVG